MDDGDTSISAIEMPHLEHRRSDILEKDIAHAAGDVGGFAGFGRTQGGKGDFCGVGLEK